MLQTIEVEIDTQGGIHPLQAVPPTAERHALLTLVVPEGASVAAAQLQGGATTTGWHGLVGKLKGSPNFNDDLVGWQRTMRHEWD